jgi:hypothetical protein
LPEIHEILEGRVGEPNSQEDLEGLYAEAERRFENQIPPGFKDKGKPKPERYGDFLIWRQILSCAQNRSCAVVFITDDSKEDWILRASGRTISIRPELREEFYAVSGQPVWIYTSEQFVQEVSSQHGKKVDKSILSEISDNVEAAQRAQEFGRINEQRVTLLRDALRSPSPSIDARVLRDFLGSAPPSIDAKVLEDLQRSVGSSTIDYKAAQDFLRTVSPSIDYKAVQVLLGTAPPRIDYKAVQDLLGTAPPRIDYKAVQDLLGTAPPRIDYKAVQDFLRTASPSIDAKVLEDLQRSVGSSMIDYKAVQDALGGINYRAVDDLTAPQVRGQAVTPPPEPIEKASRADNQSPADERPDKTRPETSEGGGRGCGDDGKKE